MIKESGWFDRIFTIFNYTFLILLVIVTLYPLLYVLFASLSDSAQLLANKGLLWKPVGFSLEAYKSVLANPGIATGFRNTLFILVFGVIVNLFMTALGAYVLSRKNVMWNKVFMFFIVFTMFFGGGLIPLYLVVKGVGLLDTLWSTILPFAISTFNLIIMRTSFMGIPDSLEESAKIDGANHFTILFRIIIPLSMPVIAVMILYYAVDKWNGWFYASVFIKSRELFPLQLVLREILIANSTESMSAGASAGDRFQIGETIKYATIMVATIPILCIYPFLQRFFVKGVMVGSLKG
ncbi:MULTISPECIES: carbohydrate ABC transporter permease [Paenibacillus]|uniref:Carbohydrate ABC transporter permease n=3 Tax=Paenibacillus TaxID=44249 RepID=A0A2V3RXU2_9BACL|nr:MULTISPECIES: carbohydrate ABC transporter permease [Paenibacillus]MDR9746019.1 carbohydrate ABC transporter permease [Paenibacillus taichungensis]MEC0107386.1 carbohydrate ABC transporter permease [Paenibacillus taichungensis]MEC0195581.1 carbohydrate ABC transporter permease [Paenibacillus taichungensis]NEU60039.1 carbohydrate ABC transporter permease [Paenibacillus sp. ALJ109b]NUU56897.1 carbohydrate ABC transporter permease [Paenibacillus taichungensis]